MKKENRSLRNNEGCVENSLADPVSAPSDAPELSIVMPCLNEADTLEVCLEKAQRALRDGQIAGEIIVADNGSTDGSQEIATRMGARVVPVSAKGYGNALKGGIAAARGRFVIMGDADDSYDFLEVPKFVAELRKGAAIAQGCRLPAGGGRVLPGAMPFLHRWWGNPMFTFMVRWMFAAPIHDVYCGLRGFTVEHYKSLNMRAPGMEFATEMIIKSSLRKAKFAEVPITLHPDGRKSHPPHLKTFRDGWRTLRFFLVNSPRWLFLYPGFALILLGLIGYSIALPGLKINGISFDAHTLLCASLAILMGAQAVQFAIFARIFSSLQGFLPDSPLILFFNRVFSMEKGLVAGLISILVGLGLIASIFFKWEGEHFGPLPYSQTMRWVIPGVTLAALGLQLMLTSFMVDVLRMRREDASS